MRNLRQSSRHSEPTTSKKPEAGAPSLFQIALVAFLILAGSEMLQEALAFTTRLLGKLSQLVLALRLLFSERFLSAGNMSEYKKNSLR